MPMTLKTYIVCLCLKFPEALYARQIGEEGSNVIAYLKDDNNNGFTLVLTANGGIDATFRRVMCYLEQKMRPTHGMPM